MLKKILAVFHVHLFNVASHFDGGVGDFGLDDFLARNFDQFSGKFAPSVSPGRNAFFSLGPDLALLSIVVIIVLGFYINASPEAKFKVTVGGARFAVMMYGFTYAIRWLGLKDRLFAPFMIVGGITAIHGIQELLSRRGTSFVISPSRE